MFCKWCGKKISKIGKPCPFCGKEQDSLENGNGFWDLYKINGGHSEEHRDRPEPRKSIPNNGPSGESRNNNRRWHALPIAAAGIIVIFMLIAIGKIGKVSSQLKNLQTEVETSTTLLSSALEGNNTLYDEATISETGSTGSTEISDTETTTETIDDKYEDLKNSRYAELKEGNDAGFVPEKRNYYSNSDNSEITVLSISVSSATLTDKDNIGFYWEKKAESSEWETLSAMDNKILVDFDEQAEYRVVVIQHNTFNNTFKYEYYNVDNGVETNTQEENEENYVQSQSADDEENNEPYDSQFPTEGSTWSDDNLDAQEF